MYQSQLLGKTIKEVPREAQTAAHRLLIRAGYIRQLAAGIYSYLPLMQRVLARISAIVRSELDAANCQELLLPALQPQELWEESQRWERYTKVDGIMFAFPDRRGSTVCLGPTHEEVITSIVRSEVASYRDLPKILYQIQTKFRDEIRPRFGLMRAREFLMKDAYSFDLDAAGMDCSFRRMEEVYHNICRRLGFDYRCVEADPGAIGGSGSSEFMALAENGEDTILHCSHCDYAANQEQAEAVLETYPQDTEELEKEDVFGEGLVGVAALAEFLQIPVWKTTKTLLYQADDEVVAIMVRGDCDVNETKVVNFLGCRSLTLAAPDVVQAVSGAEIGYAGPLNLPKEVRIIADEYVAGRVNFECGANRTNYHTINVNFGRDLPRPTLGSFKLAKADHGCPRCSEGRLRASRGIEVGHIFKLGQKYSETMGAQYLDRSGKSKAIQMGCYGIGISRMAAAIVEQNHDDRGICWPLSVAPYHAHLVALNLEDPAMVEAGRALYQKLKACGLDVLYDDRELRAGEKFNDADLIGLPLRLTLSKRTLATEQVELKKRRAEHSEMIALDAAPAHLKEQIAVSVNPGK